MLLRYAHKSRSVPRIEHNRGALDMVHPQSACADIVAEVMRRMEEKKDTNSSINNIAPAKMEQGFILDL